MEKSTLKKICYLFIEIAQYELEIEELRKILCTNIDFDPYSLYKELDRYNENYLTIFNFFDFLKEFDDNIKESFIRPFFDHYDYKNVGKLQYPSFLNIILPKTDKELREFIIYKNAMGKMLNKEIFEILFRLIQK